MVVGKVEDLRQGVESMQTVVVIVAGAGALEFIADGDLEFGAIDIFEDEAGAASYAHEVEFLHIGQPMLDLLYLQQIVLLCVCLRHHKLILFDRTPACSIHRFDIRTQLLFIKRGHPHHFLALLCWARSRFIWDSLF